MRNARLIFGVKKFSLRTGHGVAARAASSDRGALLIDVDENEDERGRSRLFAFPRVLYAYVFLGVDALARTSSPFFPSFVFHISSLAQVLMPRHLRRLLLI